MKTRSEILFHNQATVDMAKLQLFEVAVLLHPEDEEEDDSELLLEPTEILASTNDAAGLKAVRRVDHEGEEDRWEVLVRPFG